MIGAPSQELFPVSHLPEPDALHVLAIVAHWGIIIRCAVKIDVDQLLEICMHDLVRVDKDDLVEVPREQDVEELEEDRIGSRIPQRSVE
jgi:hypothetical protein